jgi:hypothetical protein
MGTDRELLEAAAKAAGIDAEWHSDEDADFDAEYLGMFLKGARSPDNDKYWNPLTSDADALRLAVKLRLDIDFEKSYMVSVWSRHLDDWVIERCDDDMGTDIAEKTRRAIVRAAAEIGRQA